MRECSEHRPKLRADGPSNGERRRIRLWFAASVRIEKQRLESQRERESVAQCTANRVVLESEGEAVSAADGEGFCSVPTEQKLIDIVIAVVVDGDSE